ncbi:MAG: Redox-sensitive transcriptional activator SoxR [Xylophilus sp.]|nr:MAG: Redox-sensitive transcriptional activator SoxR [Xylophilus sp.]
MPHGAKLTSAQWRELSSDWRRLLDERIERLTRLRDELDSCIGCGCLSLEDCPLRNPQDAMAARGPAVHIPGTPHRRTADEEGPPVVAGWRHDRQTMACSISTSARTAGLRVSVL